jgi:hypothetical protein
MDDGIDACNNGNQITGNSIFNSTQSGIHLDAIAQALAIATV